MTEPMIAGKMHSEILSMASSTRSVWYKRISPKQKKEAMNIVRGFPASRVCKECSIPLTGRQTKFCSDNCRKSYWLRNNPEYSKEYNRERRKDPEYLERERKLSLERYHERCKDPRFRACINERQRERYLTDSEYQEHIKRQARERSIERYHNDSEYRERHNKRCQERQYKNYRRIRGLPEDCDLFRPSSLELIIRLWLQDHNIEFVEQYYINLRAFGANWTRVDFFIEPNICLYCDGGTNRYYHESESYQERDARINRALERGNYIVIRLSESDILAGIRPIEILELIVR